jgi:hypothetical protein
VRGAALSFVLASVGSSTSSVARPARQPNGRTFLEAADLADRNGLYYPFMQAWLRGGGRTPPTHRERWARELSAREALLHTLSLLNRVAEVTGTEYTVIKDSAVPDAVPRDVDILVHPRMSAEFLKGLAREGLVSLFDNEAEHSFVGPDTMRVDVYNRIHYLGREFISLEHLRTSRVPKITHGVEHPGLNPSASFLVNSIHGLLGHAALSLLDFLDLCENQDMAGDLAAVRAQADEAGWGRCFDRWVAYLLDLRTRVVENNQAIRFPLRHGHRLIRACLSEIDGDLPRKRGLLDLSLLWDDLVFYSEDSGLREGLKRSRLATAMANATGHRLRILRGDRKAMGGGIGVDALGRGRTRFR